MKATAGQYVGLDAHQATLVIVVMDILGAVLQRTTIPTDAKRVLGFLRSLDGPVYVTFEEGALAQWLYDLITPLVEKVIVCNARKHQHKGNKSDDRDAEDLANRLRMNDLSPVWHQIDDVRVLKQLAASYSTLVADSVRTMVRIKSLFLAQAIACRGQEVYSPARRKALVNKLGTGARQRGAVLYEQLDVMQRLRPKAKLAMVREARGHAAYPVIKQCPYLGPVRTAQLLAALVTPWRFRTKRQLWGYAGLAVVTHSSSDRHFVEGKLVRVRRAPMTRGLNRNHNPLVKEIFKAAAHDASCRPGPLGDLYRAMVARGMRREMALLTLARKIATVALHLWKKGGSFDPAKLTTQQPQMTQ